MIPGNEEHISYEVLDGQTVNIKYVEIRYSIHSKTMLILLCKPQICWLWLTIVCAIVPAHRSMFVYIYEEVWVGDWKT